MTNNPPPAPTGPNGPRVPASEPEQEQRIFQAALDEIRSENRITVFCIEAFESFLNGSGLTITDNGFIIASETGEEVTPYTYSHNAFANHDDVSDKHLIDYFEPANTVRDFIPERDRLHITDVHGFVPGTENTPHQHPVPDDTLTITRYNKEIGCVLPAVTAWSSLWNSWKAHEDTFTTGNFVMKTPLTGNPPELTCLRCDFTAPQPEWRTEPRNDVQDIGYGNVHFCPECDCQWDTNSISTCTNCGTESSAEELDYIGDGLHVESRCPHCGEGPVREQVTDRYDS